MIERKSGFGPLAYPFQTVNYSVLSALYWQIYNIINNFRRIPVLILPLSVHLYAKCALIHDYHFRIWHGIGNTIYSHFADHAPSWVLIPLNKYGLHTLRNNRSTASCILRIHAVYASNRNDKTVRFLPGCARFRIFPVVLIPAIGGPSQNGDQPMVRILAKRKVHNSAGYQLQWVPFMRSVHQKGIIVPVCLQTCTCTLPP